MGMEGEGKRQSEEGREREKKERKRENTSEAALATEAQKVQTHEDLEFLTGLGLRF